MRDLLHRLGYEYKNPTCVPGNSDEDAQEIFVGQYEVKQRHNKACVQNWRRFLPPISLFRSLG